MVSTCGEKQLDWDCREKCGPNSFQIRLHLRLLMDRDPNLHPPPAQFFNCTVLTLNQGLCLKTTKVVRVVDRDPNPPSPPAQFLDYIGACAKNQQECDRGGWMGGSQSCILQQQSIGGETIGIGIDFIHPVTSPPPPRSVFRLCSPNSFESRLVFRL